MKPGYAIMTCTCCETSNSLLNHKCFTLSINSVSYTHLVYGTGGERCIKCENNVNVMQLVSGKVDSEVENKISILK